MQAFRQKLEAMIQDKEHYSRGQRIEMSKDLLWFLFDMALWKEWMDEESKDDMERVMVKYECC